MGAMTKKHFQAIATAIRDARALTSPLAEAAIDAVAESIADRLAEDSPRFNRARFLAACGVEGQVTQ